MRKIVTGLVLVVMMILGGLVASPAMAENAFTKEACSGADEMQKAALGCDNSTLAPSVVQYILNAVIAVVGIVAVVMIVVAGQRYIVSNGDPGKMQQARNMIIYSLIGLIVALLSFAVVNFVLGGIFSS